MTIRLGGQGSNMSEQGDTTGSAAASAIPGCAIGLLERGSAPTADDLVSPLLPTDPRDGRAWFGSAGHFAAAGRYGEALECCRRAVANWPDMLPVLQLALDLADRVGDRHAALDLTGDMLPLLPNDPVLKNRLAGLLCAQGKHAEALPLLRVAAPVLKHADNALWNYTSSLVLTGGFDELLTLEPLLDGLAGTVPPPYGPYVHLAIAKLAASFDLAEARRQNQALRTSPQWLDVPRLIEPLTVAIQGGAPLSMIRISAVETRLFLTVQPHEPVRLRPQEMSAAVNSAWQSWFSESIESHDDILIEELGQGLLRSIDTADIVIVPENGLVGGPLDQASFGASLQRLLLDRLASGRSPNPHFTDDGIMAQLQESMPFLRPMLSGLPFLGFIGWHTEMADKLAHFCGIARLVTYPVPADKNLSDLPAELRVGQHFPKRYRQVLDSLVVPHRGAVFLVAAGVLGKLYVSHIKALGGVALDVGSLAERWAGY